MFQLGICRARVARNALQRTLYASRVAYAHKAPEPAGDKANEEKPESTKGDSAKLPPRPEVNEDGEKIEYFGNTRFPKPRAKPRRTITPGDAVGQATPAVKPTPQPLKDQLQQKWRDILSPEKNMEARARIIHDIGHSYFQDIVDLRNNGDKLFEAPKQLIPSARARFLPSLPGKTLLGDSCDLIDLCSGKLTLLSINFTKFSEKHTQSFIEPFEAAFGEQEGVQVVQLNVEENWAKAMVLQLCLPFLRRQIPKHRHGQYLVHYGNVEDLRKSLGIANPLIGYVFLVDKKMRVRWYANGLAIMSEAQAMVALAKRLG
ncbi:Mitochondrial ATPase complex subunit atp10 [Coemansia sp. RSA 2336]|nr:Mitochondrial ATPase complex subunit atp10 [Coemansia sp. RSA 2336]